MPPYHRSPLPLAASATRVCRCHCVPNFPTKESFHKTLFPTRHFPNDKIFLQKFGLGWNNWAAAAFLQCCAWHWCMHTPRTRRPHACASV